MNADDGTPGRHDQDMARYRTITRLGVTAAVLVLVAGCGGGGRDRAPAQSAAEPAVSPTGGPAPAGRVVAIGSAPEGVVYDARTGLVAVGVRDPDQLVLLDGATMAVRHRVALPGHVRHLQLAGVGGPVLVPVENANALLEVQLPGGRITSRVGVGSSPHDATAAADGRTVAGDEFGGSLTVVRGGRVERTIRGVDQPGGVIGHGDEVAVVDVHAYTVSDFDLATGVRTDLLPAGAGPTHEVLLPGHRLAVVDTRGGAVLTFALDPLVATGRLALPGAPYGIAVDTATSTVWVTLTARNEVVGLDVSTAVPRQIAEYPTVEQPNTVAVAPGSHTLWITGTRRGQLEQITR